MAGFGFSPADIVDLCKFSYRAYKEAKSASERYVSARALADRIRETLDVIPIDNDQTDPATRVLASHLKEANNAYSGLDKYLRDFEEHIGPQRNSSDAGTKIVARARWTTGQLDKKVDKLQDAVESAMRHCEFAIIVQTNAQISAQISASVQKTHGTPTADGENAVTVDASPRALVVQADTDMTEQPCWQGRGGCGCRCHYTKEYSGSFFYWVSRGFISPLEPCNVDGCNSRRYVLSLRVALNRLGFSVAVIPSLQFIISPDYRLQILPSLQMQRTRKYTSEGFRALYLLQHGYDTSDRKWSDEQRSARFVTYKQDKLAEIKQLFYEGKVSHLDVDPSGATWLEKLLQVPWGVGSRWAQYDLLEYLVLRSKKDIQENPRLLFQVARWIGEGPSLDMLATLIRLGLDPGKLDPSLFSQWPSFTNPDWQAEAITPDPFGIDFLRQCLKIEPEFAGCDLLMTHLLTGSDQDFEKVAQHWATNERSGGSYHKNAFGQSALHLAVIFPKRLEKLLELGMRPKVIDLGDTTPLMYAAAYGQWDSILALLGYDCCIYAYDKLNGRCFIDYALVYRHLNLITKLVQWLREQAASELALDLLGCCIRMTFAQSSFWSNSGTLDCLFRLCGDSDIALGSTTSMHLARDIEDARVVLENKFTAVEVVDMKGETATIRVSRFLDTRLLYKMLDIEATAGVSIDRQDFSGWSVLMHVTNCMDERNSHLPEETVQLRRASAVGCLNMLLLRGASPTLTDSCNCPCSPDGCSALSIALHRAVESIGIFESATSISRIPLDFAIALQTCTDEHLQWATDTFKTFVDFLETGEFHTCCARRRARSGLWSPPSDCSDSQNARKHTPLATSAGNPSQGGIPFQLARLYDALQRGSQAKHDETLAREGKRNLDHRRKQRSSGLIIDTVRDHYTHLTVLDISVPPVLRVDIDAYRDWIAWCVAQPRKLYSRRSLAAWARESSTFVDRLEEELASLA